MVTEGVSDTAEAETKGSQSAAREQTVFLLNSQFSLMKRIMSHHCEMARICRGHDTASEALY